MDSMEVMSFYSKIIPADETQEQVTADGSPTVALRTELFHREAFIRKKITMALQWRQRGQLTRCLNGVRFGLIIYTHYNMWHTTRWLVINLLKATSHCQLNIFSCAGYLSLNSVRKSWMRSSFRSWCEWRCSFIMMSRPSLYADQICISLALPPHQRWRWCQYCLACALNQFRALTMTMAVASAATIAAVFVATSSAMVNERSNDEKKMKDWMRRDGTRKLWDENCGKHKTEGMRTSKSTTSKKHDRDDTIRVFRTRAMVWYLFGRRRRFGKNDSGEWGFQW